MTASRVWAGGQEPFIRRVAYRGLLVVVFTIQWDGVVQIGGLGTLNRLLGLALLPVAGAAIVLDGQRNSWRDVHAVALAFSGWVIASALWTVNASQTADRSFRVVQVLGLLLLVWEFADTPRRFRNLVLAYVSGGGVLIVTAIWTYLRGTTGARFQLGNIHPNDIAFLLAITVVLSWWVSFHVDTALQRTLLRCMVPAALFATVLTASRSGLFTSAIAVLIVPATAGALSRAGRRRLIVALIVLAPIVPTVLPAEQLLRLSTTAGEISEGNLNDRRDFWTIGIEMFESEPLRGVGAGGSRQRLSESVLGRNAGLHNTYLSVAAELGVVGLGLFLLLVLAAVSQGWTTRIVERRALVVLTIVTMIGLFPRHWEYEKSLWFILAVLAGIGRFGGQLNRLAASEEAARSPSAT